MRTLRLTDHQHALLLALLNSDVLGYDSVADLLGEAAAEILGHTGEDEDAEIDAQIELQNSMVEALCTPAEETDDLLA